jgi:hypothetical protein
MEYFSSILAFFGVSSRNDKDIQSAGRWRSAILIGFICWSLQNASLFDEEWVGGGVEFDFNPETMSRMNPFIQKLVSSQSNVKNLHADPPRFKASFSYGLDILTWVTQIQFSASNEVSIAKIQFDLLAFIRNCVADIALGGNQFKELASVDTTKLNSTKDLLTIGLVLQYITLILMILASYKIPLFGSYALSRYHLVAKLFGPLGCFLHAVGIFNFAGSGLLKGFCDAFDPDPTLGFLPCGYGAGFDTGAVAIPFMILYSWMCFYWAPWNDVDVVSLPFSQETNSSSLKSGQYEAISTSTGSGTSSATSFSAGFNSSL